MSNDNECFVYATYVLSEFQTRHKRDEDDKILERLAFPTGSYNMRVILNNLCDNGYLEEVASFINEADVFNLTPKGLYYKEQIATIKAIEKKRDCHDYKIALFSLVGGGIMGFLTSLCFWLLS